MAYLTKTVLDLPVITDLQSTDKLYLIRGTGVGRDKQAAASVLQAYVGDTVIEVTSTGGVDLSTYYTNLVIKCNPTAGISLTITNELPDGKRLEIINISAYTVSLTIEGDTYNVESGFHVSYLSDGTNMQQLNQIAGDLTIDGDLTSIETTNLKVTDKNIEVNVGSTTALTVGAGISILGDSDAEVGYFKINGSDNSLLTMKAPTGNVLTLDINADKELEMSANLTVTADVTVNGVTIINGGLTVESLSLINQDLTTDADVNFNSVTTTDISDFKNLILGDANANIFITDTGEGAITSGVSNVSVGYGAGEVLTSGQRNTLIGRNAGRLLTTGGYNTSIGFQSGFSLLGGSENITIGYNAGSGLTSGSTNIHIGKNAGSIIATANNTIVIGNITGVSTSDTTYVDNIWGVTTTGGIAVYCNSNGQLGTSTSSIRHKENITDAILDSSKIYELQLYSFNYRDINKTESIGYTAEDVDYIFPEFVIKITKEHALGTKTDPYLEADKDEFIPEAIDYTKFIFPIIEEMKKLKNRIEILESL